MEYEDAVAENSAMVDETELLRSRIASAIQGAGMDPTEAARKIGRAKDYIRDFLDGRKDSIKAADLARLEVELSLAPGSFMLPANVIGTYRPPPVFLGDSDLPVFSATEGGRGEMVISTDPIDVVPRPWFLKSVREGYAVVVSGYSMEPRYEAGDLVVVNPRAPLVRGKDAIITTAREGGDFRAMIKTYLGTTSSAWRLRQYNPPPGEGAEFEALKKLWPFALRVVGRYDGG